MFNRENMLITLNRAIEWSLVILIFSLPFSKSMIEISSIFAITCWVLKRLLLGKEWSKLVRIDLDLPLTIFYLANFLSIFWSTYPDISIKAFIRKLTEYILLYFIVVDTVREKKVVRNIVLALALSSIIVIVDGIHQKFTGHDFIRGYTMYGLERITASFEFPNSLSAWLVVVSFPFISLALCYKKSPKITVFNATLATFLVYSLFLAYTKGAVVSFMLGLVLMFLLIGWNKSVKKLILVILVIAVIILVLPQGIKNYINPAGVFTDRSSLHRFRMWQTGWRMFIARPLLGQGLNTFMANYERFKLAEDTATGIWYAHNCFLQMAAEIGIFGLTAFLWLIAKIVSIFLKSWRLFINDDFLRYVYLGLFCGIIAFLIHSSVETSLYSLKLAVLFYFSLGLLMGIKNIGLGHEKI